jgi:hypothetical protein
MIRRVGGGVLVERFMRVSDDVMVYDVLKLGEDNDMFMLGSYGLINVSPYYRSTQSGRTCFSLMV